MIGKSNISLKTSRPGSPKHPNMTASMFSYFVISESLSTAGIIEAISSYEDSIELPPFGTS